jgi:hypothetical protein
MLGDGDMPPSSQRLASQEQARHAVADILVIIALDHAGSEWQRSPRLADELLGGLVDAEHRPLGIISAVVNLQHVFHVIDEFR